MLPLSYCIHEGDQLKAPVRRLCLIMNRTDNYLQNNAIIATKANSEQFEIRLIDSVKLFLISLKAAGG